jgi:hypothetical protein
VAHHKLIKRLFVLGLARLGGLLVTFTYCVPRSTPRFHAGRFYLLRIGRNLLLAGRNALVEAGNLRVEAGNRFLVLGKPLVGRGSIRFRWWRKVLVAQLTFNFSFSCVDRPLEGIARRARFVP